jgi:hypothetical protein
MAFNDQSIKQVGRLPAGDRKPTLEFSERAEHVKDKTPLRRRRVDGFRQRTKANPPRPQLFNRLDQLLDGASEAVELPHNQRVARPRKFQSLFQFRTVSARQLWP